MNDIKKLTMNFDDLEEALRVLIMMANEVPVYLHTPEGVVEVKNIVKGNVKVEVEGDIYYLRRYGDGADHNRG